MLAIKRCKHFELGGDKKRKVSVVVGLLVGSYQRFHPREEEVPLGSPKQCTGKCGLQVERKVIAEFCKQRC